MEEPHHEEGEDRTSEPPPDLATEKESSLGGFLSGFAAAVQNTVRTSVYSPAPMVVPT